ncbi:MAG: tRNA preQ1(34) S-adenosylmethionine ribosyltransferase-isomerase QueA [Gammaproteobacteria bacterium]|nr:tRNA preQ1(34) S-adenosylmethionine ribosyltransferase-isomerase QueA [Gammaproteobacteria bacterium]
MPLTKSDFSYSLPSRLIARKPLSKRTDSRLMVLGSAGYEHRRFRDLIDYLRPGDVLVVNDSKVVKARLHAVKDSGGQAEILVERIETDTEALCQVAVSKPLKSDRTLDCCGQTVTVIAREGEFYRLRFDRPVLEFLDEFGSVPLPPYIRRIAQESDEQRYQTVYANKPGAVAAPTAGLHFDDEFLAQIERKDVEICRVTLHVGAGTFQPIRVNDLSQHVMHQERFEIPDETVARLLDQASRVVAVGTTVVRTLESWAQNNETSGETRLFITPGFKFQIVDALVTNFHLPESTLLMLVSAFYGRERMLAAYEEAVRQEYRFYSYGDAMFLERTRV